VQHLERQIAPRSPSSDNNRDETDGHCARQTLSQPTDGRSAAQNASTYDDQHEPQLKRPGE
jgi:hypothetical protein